MKTITPIGPIFWEFVPWLVPLKSGVGISFNLLLTVFRSKKLLKFSKMHFFALPEPIKTAIKSEKSKNFKIATPDLCGRVHRTYSQKMGLVGAMGFM
ncbi:MAG: hypothetical protein GY782_10475 [Gammaproteobacteria bacterium]|nr:hypothetical protein [Gammaproteobacteria bacterium]